MKLKNVRLRMDSVTGDVWLVEEKPYHPIKRLKNMTGDILLALSAETTAEEGTKQAVREVRFSDGALIRLTTEIITDFSGPPAVGSAQKDVGN